MDFRSPLWVDALTYPASVDRLLAGAFAYDQNGLPGGVYGPSTSFKVTQNAAVNTTVDVAIGCAFVPQGGSTIGRGWIVAGETSAFTIDSGAAPVTNPRNDIVYLEVRDASITGTNNDFQIGIAIGAENASPVDATITGANVYALARIRRFVGDNTIANADIDDLRAFNNVGRKSQFGYVTTQLNSTVTTYTAIPSLDFTVQPYTVYKFDGVIYYIASTAGDIKILATMPANAALSWASVGPDVTETGADNTIGFFSWVGVSNATSSPVGGVTYGGLTSASNTYIDMKGILVTGKNGGSFNFQFAEVTASGTASILVGSYLDVHEKKRLPRP